MFTHRYTCWNVRLLCLTMKSVDRRQTNKHTNKQKTFILSKNWGNLFLPPSFLFSIILSVIVWKLKQAVSNFNWIYQSTVQYTSLLFRFVWPAATFLLSGLQNVLRGCCYGISLKTLLHQYHDVFAKGFGGQTCCSRTKGSCYCHRKTWVCR